MSINHLAEPPAQQAHANPVFQLVFEDLHQRIGRGDWLPGERLPSIVQLASDLAASTGSVREALRALQSLGLIQIAHGRGVFVAGAPSTQDPAWSFQEHQRDSFVALAEARYVVEPQLAALAADRGTDTQLAGIERLARQIETQVQLGQAFADLDDRFHCWIAQAACNPVLSQMIEQIIAVSRERCAITCLSPQMAAHEVRYHLLIADALYDRNPPQARLLMQAHMQDAFGTVLASEAQVRQVGA